MVKPYHAAGAGLSWESGRVGNRPLNQASANAEAFFISTHVKPYHAAGAGLS